MTPDTRHNLEEYLRENATPDMNEADSIDFMIKRMEEQEQERQSKSESNQ